MSFNGSGVWSANSAGQPVVANTLIDATVFNAFTADVATGLTNTMTRDGQNAATGDQHLGGYKIYFDVANSLYLVVSSSNLVVGGGKLVTVASATGGAGFNLPHGAAPTSPVDGDFWTTSAGGAFVRVNGATVGPLAAAGNLVKLATLTPTAAAAVNFLSTFSSSYDNYLIIGDGISPAADDTLRMRFAVVGVSDSGSNYYQSGNYSGTNVTATNTSIRVSSLTQITGAFGMNFAIVVANANDATRMKTAFCDSACETVNTPAFAGARDVNHYTAANAVSGGTLFWSGANNFSAVGTIRIYGYG